MYPTSDDMAKLNGSNAFSETINPHLDESIPRQFPVIPGTKTSNKNSPRRAPIPELDEPQNEVIIVP